MWEFVKAPLPQLLIKYVTNQIQVKFLKINILSLHYFNNIKKVKNV